MSSTLYGTVLLALWAGIFTVSIWNSRKGNPAIALALLMLMGFVLRMYCASDLFLHDWDERYHALVAKHMACHFLQPTLYDNPILPYSIPEWTNNHVWLHKQPMALWLIALSLKTFGLHPFVVRLPSILLSTLGIKLMYDIAAGMFDRSVAFYSAFLFATNGLILDLVAGRGATDHVDSIFLFFVLATVWCMVKFALRGKVLFLLLAGCALGLAVLTKWITAFLVLLLFVQMLWGKQKPTKVLANLLMITAVASAVFLPWQFYIFSHYPREAAWEFQYNGRHFSEVLENQKGDIFYHFNYLRVNYGELIYLPVVLLTLTALRTQRRNLLILFTWFWAPFLFYTLAATKMPAYTLIAAPSIFMITAVYFCRWFNFKSEIKWKHYLARVIAYGLLLLPVRYSLERIKPFAPVSESEWNKQINRFAEFSLNNTKTVILNCPHAIEMMFATDCICYDNTPDSTTINKLKESGYTTIIFH